MTDTALLIIDLQNDYFDDGTFPLWKALETKDKLVELIEQAKKKGVLPIHIQHIADPAQGIAPFFNQDTQGAEIQKDILAAAPDAPIVVKHFADSFEKTNLEELLTQHGIKTLWIAGMMTQNCVTHTAISKAAEKYTVWVLTDACTSVNEMLHMIALHAISTRVKLADSAQLL